MDSTELNAVDATHQPRHIHRTQSTGVLHRRPLSRWHGRPGVGDGGAMTDLDDLLELQAGVISRR
jgi:hypothetical protein